MDLVAALAAVIAPVFALSLVGYLWGRFGRAFDHHFVTELVTLVGAPCLVFSTLTRARFAAADLGRLAAASLACLALFAAVSLCGLLLLRMRVRVYLPSLVFPNMGNMGLPVCLFAFGDAGLALGTIYFAVTSICQFTFGPAIASGRFHLGTVLKVPFIYAVIAALALAALGVRPPEWVNNTVSLAAGLTIPLMLLGLGVALGELDVDNLPRALAMSAARIGIGLGGGLLVAHLFGLTGASRGVLVIESAMPVAVFNYLFARMYDNDPREVAGMVVISTLLSYLTLPLVVALVR